MFTRERKREFFFNDYPLVEPKTSFCLTGKWQYPPTSVPGQRAGAEAFMSIVFRLEFCRRTPDSQGQKQRLPA